MKFITTKFLLLNEYNFCVFIEYLFRIVYSIDCNDEYLLIDSSINLCLITFNAKRFITIIIMTFILFLCSCLKICSFKERLK